MFTPEAARIAICSALDALRESLRPDQPPAAHVDALRRVEEVITRAVRRELISPAASRAYQTRADALLRETEDEILERSQRRATPIQPSPYRPRDTSNLAYSDTWATPAARAAVAGEVGWSTPSDPPTRYEESMDVLVFDDESLFDALDTYSTDELHRLMRTADSVLWARENGALGNVIPFPR